MIRTFEQRHSLGGIACPMGGGGGGSSSSAQNTSTTTNNTDKRMVLDGGSVGFSTDGGGASFQSTSNTTSNTNIQTIDSSSIAAGRDIALTSISNNSTNLDHLLATADHLISQQQNGIQAAADLTKTLAGTAQTAYADASNQASGNKQLILAAIAVVGVVAFSSLRK